MQEMGVTKVDTKEKWDELMAESGKVRACRGPEETPKQEGQ